jgi:Co/Zn/Cd efflux system component
LSLDASDAGQAHEDSHDAHGHRRRHDRHHDHDHDHDHDHPGGFRGFLHDLFVPHTHDAADSLDDAVEASREGVRALKVSLFVLLGTTVLQFVLVLVTGSVALLADTVHNFSDALTAVPLWVAFLLGRRPASKRYTYGFGRAEDLAGLFIVAVVLSRQWSPHGSRWTVSSIRTPPPTSTGSRSPA